MAEERQVPRSNSSTSTISVRETAVQAGPQESYKSEKSREIIDFSTPFLFSDTIIEVQNEKLHCHKAILSLHSPVFKAMFVNNFKENTTNLVVLDHDSADNVRELLLYFYTPGGRDVDNESAQRLLPVIHRYQIDYLLEIMERKLTSALNDSSVVDLIKLADHFNLNDLKQAALDRLSKQETAKLLQLFSDGKVAAENQIEIFKRRSMLLEQCITDVQRSFSQSCVKVESKLERTPSNHCEHHAQPLSRMGQDENERGICEHCVTNFRTHIVDLCKRAMHKVPVVFLKD